MSHFKAKTRFNDDLKNHVGQKEPDKRIIALSIFIGAVILVSFIWAVIVIGYGVVKHYLG